MRVMTGELLADIGAKLYGDRWPAVLAKKLGRAKKTISRYRCGTRNVPKDVRLALMELVDEQFEIVAQLRAELRSESPP